MIFDRIMLPAQGRSEDYKFAQTGSVTLAGVAELADAQDLKSCDANTSYRFDSGLGHQCNACAFCAQACAMRLFASARQFGLEGFQFFSNRFMLCVDLFNDRCSHFFELGG